ncbi:hypothetical protein pb186bvf_017773 [Paramecium bursaria]
MEIQIRLKKSHSKNTRNFRIKKQQQKYGFDLQEPYFRIIFRSIKFRIREVEHKLTAVGCQKKNYRTIFDINMKIIKSRSQQRQRIQNFSSDHYQWITESEYNKAIVIWDLQSQLRYNQPKKDSILKYQNLLF